MFFFCGWAKIFLNFFLRISYIWYIFVPMKRNWIKYTTWTNIEAGYCFDENGEVMIKVFSKMPKRFYYSACNEAGDYFDEVIKPTL